MTEQVLLEVRGDGVAVLTLHRPERRNAWTAEMERQYFALLDDLDTNPRVRAVVVTGSGSSFCPGVDSQRLEQVAGMELRQDGRRSPFRAWAMRKPMVAAINGGCAGVGLMQALVCDVRFAARGARISTAFTRRGLAGEYGMTWLLPKVVGLAAATDLLLSGRTVEADEAQALGLISRVTEPEDLLSEALAYAGDLAAHCAPTSLALVRHQLHLDLEGSLEDAMSRAYRAMAYTIADVDLAEGVASLVERRAPAFRALPVGYDPAAVVGKGVRAIDLRPEDLLDQSCILDTECGYLIGDTATSVTENQPLMRERHTMTLDVPVFDADNHLYETRDSLTKFLPARYKGAIDYVEVRGRTKIVLRGQISNFIPNPTFDVIARPGAQEDYFRNGNPEGKKAREIFGEPMECIPAYREPAPRLELMNEQGIDRALMFPTLASLLEERLRDDPDLTAAAVHALNEWLYETWQFNYQDRIFTTPVVTLGIQERALEELDWVVKRGARAILVRPAPAWGYRGPRSFALPEFDPFWTKVVEHNLLVCLHSSDSGYERYTNDWVGSGGEFLPFQPQAFRMMSSWRPIEDAVASLVTHGALSRFPTLKIAVIENGSSWVAPLMQTMKDVYKKMPQEFLENPVDVLKRVHISPFWEEDLGALAKLIGEDRVLFGSDYPHPEGLADPASYVKELRGLSDAAVRKIMGGNLARLLNVKDAVLR